MKHITFNAMQWRYHRQMPSTPTTSNMTACCWKRIPKRDLGLAFDEWDKKFDGALDNVTCPECLVMWDGGKE